MAQVFLERENASFFRQSRFVPVRRGALLVCVLPILPNAVRICANGEIATGAGFLPPVSNRRHGKPFVIPRAKGDPFVLPRILVTVLCV